MANGHLCLVTAKLHQPHIRVDRDVDVGVLLSKPIEARDQPRAGKRGFDADPKHGLGWFSQDLRKPHVDLVEAGGQLIQQEPARFGQFDPPMQALEQRLADECFQLADLTADRGLRHEQFFGRSAEAHQAARSLKASHCRQRQTSAPHAHNLTLSDPDRKLV